MQMLYLKTVQDKYILLYMGIYNKLHIYITAIRALATGYLPISLIIPLNLKEILSEDKIVIRKTNPDNALVIKRLHLYYDISNLCH